MAKTPAPTVLLTGFVPFGGADANPSWDAVRALDGVRIRGHRVATRCLPVEFGRSLKELRAAIRELKPALVLCVGVAGGRAEISLERVAINVDDARIPTFAAHGYRVQDVEPYIENGDLQGFFVTYQKP